MKKTLFIAALVLMSAGCMAQKANVKKAKSYALNTESPNFTEARKLIGDAIENPETANQAETYYVAGLIGYQENMMLVMNSVLSGGADQAQCGAAITESYDYWLKADELAMIPTLDKKGREVVDTKTRNNIVKKMLEYFKGQNFIQYGLYLNDQRDYANAYHAFMKHVQMPDLPMMQDPKLQKEMPKDTTYNLYLYYAGLFASQAEMHKEAIEIFEQLKDGETEPLTCNQILYQEYVAMGDTAASLVVLQNAMAKFPQEAWFLQNMINYYVYSNQSEEAIKYLDEAIERDPTQAQYYYSKGTLELSLMRYDAAKENFQKAIELDAKMVNAIAGMGRAYYFEAMQMNEEASSINDTKAYKAALAKANEVFRKSMPYFEQAHELEPDNRDHMNFLRGLYYRFDMTDKYNAIMEKMNQ